MRNIRMTGRERVERMLRHEDHDSIPRMETVWDETLERWESEGLVGSVYEYLGQDFQAVSWIEPFPFPGQHVPICEDEETVTYRDQYNNVMRSWKWRSGTPEHVEFGCKDRHQWETEYKQRYLDAAPSFNLDASFRDVAMARRNGRWSYFAGLETFEMARKLVGDETFLIAMAEEPEWVIDMSNTFTDVVLRDLDDLWEEGLCPDGLWIYGDMAYRRGTMCGPKFYRNLVWPDHKRMADWAHERGLPMIYHTDGDINGVLDDYVDACFDCLQPLEAKAGMDITKLAPTYGDKVAFFGNIDVMVMATNDRDLIEQEIKTKLTAGKSTKAYAYHSDHSVPPSVSWETYQFIVELIDKYGNY